MSIYERNVPDKSDAGVFSRSPGHVRLMHVSGSLNNTVRTICIDTADKILVGGEFTHIGATKAYRIIRLKDSGFKDHSFDYGTGFNNTVHTIFVDANGKILVGGTFTAYDGTPANLIIRLNSDGSIDNTFDSGDGFNNSGLRNIVRTICIDTADKILVGGTFTSYDGTPANNIIRLNSDGSIDNTFDSGDGFMLHNPLSAIDVVIYSICVDANGKILVGGYFTRYDGTPANYIIRLNSNGSIDNTFDSGDGFSMLVPFRNIVTSICIDANNKILVGGRFEYYDDTNARQIIRLNSDGSIDNTFDSGDGFVTGFPNSICIDANNKILVGGRFHKYNGTPANCIVRLDNDGSIDSTFNYGDGFDVSNDDSEEVYTVFVDANGKILVGGTFASYDGTQARYLVRLNDGGGIDKTFKAY